MQGVMVLPEKRPMPQNPDRELDFKPDILPTETATMSPGTRMRILSRVLSENPDYVSLGGAARILKLSKGAVYQCHSDLPGKVVEGIRLYHRQSVESYARKHHSRQAGKLVFHGIDVERLQRICEHYFRVTYDSAPPELKALAKKVAKL